MNMLLHDRQIHDLDGSDVGDSTPNTRVLSYLRCAWICPLEIATGVKMLREGRS